MRYLLGLVLCMFTGPALAVESGDTVEVTTTIGNQREKCHEQTPCPLGDRSYHIKEPDDWDGVTPLPVLLHFHGWQRQGTLIVKHGRISGATRRRGVLLVAPNGARRTWDFWHAGTPDVAFARAVLEEVKARYPVDDTQIFVSGYSWGSNMAWRFVCEDGADITALLAISGTLSQDEECGTAPDRCARSMGYRTPCWTSLTVLMATPPTR